VGTLYMILQFSLKFRA